MSGWFLAAIIFAVSGLCTGGGGYPVAVRRVSPYRQICALGIVLAVMTALLGLALFFALMGATTRYF